MTSGAARFVAAAVPLSFGGASQGKRRRNAGRRWFAAALAPHQGQDAIEGIVPRHGECVKLEAVVVGDETGARLKVLRRESEFGLRPIDEMSLASRFQRAAQSSPRFRIVRISGTANSLVTWPSEL